MGLIFLIGLLAITPLLTMMLRTQPAHLPLACAALGFLLFFLEPWLYAAPVSWAGWPGPVKGAEVSIIDAIAVAIILATRPAGRVPWALKLGMAVYAAGFLVSIFAAELWMAAAFYGWQVVRAAIVFVAILRACNAHPKAPYALFLGIGAGLVLEAGLAVVQFARGNLEPGGTLGHRNLLGMASYFAALPAFALLLAGKRSGIALAIVGAALIIAFVGGSRATIGLLAIGLVVTTSLSIFRKPTGRKMGFAMIAIGLLAVAPIAMNWALERRSSGAAESAARERAAMLDAARMIISEHPLGIGANHYALVAATGGYSARAGVAWAPTSRGAPVHNSYYLAAAELGMLGALGLLAFLAAAIVSGLRALRRVPAGGVTGELMIGFVSVVIVLSAHLAFEWLFFSFYIHYLLAMVLGAMVAIAGQARRPAFKGRNAAVAPNADGLRSREPGMVFGRDG